ncbi:hypothetical protein Pmar_PMAR017594 [Perkinsus marinus ATCC 50983]|uniref:Uncharacterized protein n=1 Tax=Perkinsus marinus (strain ATCC 50983 / TXsc) TaxID=423536 RepID=C5L3G5_PERM5|nr:hypothetical protein Pmar_PMAR017594 [Perkinsus marinus ATCC 50983]EER08544.1 hypothetical protein Pmar_PMAR017594 [Perkinsus marinus ATCC 50983]|eukprot:XP_002776728.1 hypothetical protein Pmar_PMAR017594 [Perkinsus marinus ATCC 50983]
MLTVPTKSPGRLMLVALWLHFIITTNADMEFLNSKPHEKKHTHEHSGHHHIKNGLEKDSRFHPKIHNEAHHGHGEKVKSKRQSSSILEQHSAPRRRLRDAQSDHSDVIQQLSEPLVQPLPTEQDEADLFNSKTDLLDTKAFLTDPDLQPIYYHSALETNSHSAAGGNSTVAPPESSTGITAPPQTAPVVVAEEPQTGWLHKITHVCLAVIGICLLLVGVIAVVHTGYRRKVLDSIKSQGRIKEVLSASWYRVGNYFGNAKSEEESGFPIIVDPFPAHPGTIGGA